MKLINILEIVQIINKINIDEVNSVTAYWLARNARKLSPYAEKFEADRKKILDMSWVEEYNLLVKEDKESAQTKYKVQIEESDKEIKDLLNQEITVELYKKPIEVIDVESRFIPGLIDLIFDGDDDEKN